MTSLVHVLLVDDEPDFLELTAARLRHRGLDVHTAANGEQALQRLAQGDIHVVVLDVSMPGMDGYSLFQIISERFPRVESIILTGHGSVAKAFETSKDGLFEYLEKPCDITKLNDRIRKACQYLFMRLDEEDSAEPS